MFILVVSRRLRNFFQQWCLLHIAIFTLTFSVQASEVEASKQVNTQSQTVDYRLKCEKETCHSSVAALVSNVGVCTAFLVSENTVITNNHCVPAELKTEGASCSGKIKFIFPEMDGYAKEEIDCETIKRISDMSSETISMDVAIIRLKVTTRRAPLQVSLDGLANGDEVRVIKIDPDASGGTQKRVTCFALQNSLANPFYKNSGSPLFLVRDCEIVRGNSGSPMLNKNGQVIGVISAVGATTIDNSKKAEGHISLGTNLACYRDLSFTNNFKPQQECKVDLSKQARVSAEKKIFENMSNELQTRLVDAVNKELIAINGNYHKFMQLKWTEQKVINDSNATTGVLIKYEPECLFPNIKDLREYEIRLKETSSALNYSFEQIFADFELNAYLVPVVRVTKQKMKRLITLNIAEAKKTGQFVAMVYSENGQKLSESKLPFCNLRMQKN